MAELFFSDVIQVYKAQSASQMPEAILGMLLSMPNLDRERLEDVAKLLQKGPGDQIAKYTGDFQQYMLDPMRLLPAIPPVPEKDTVVTLGEFNDYYKDFIQLSEDAIRIYFDTILVDEKEGSGTLAFNVKLPHLKADGEKVIFSPMAECIWRDAHLRTFKSTKEWKQDIDRAIGLNSSGVYYTLNAASFVSMDQHPGKSVTTDAILAALNKETLREVNLHGLYITEIMARVSAFTQPRFETLFTAFFRK